MTHQRHLPMTQTNALNELSVIGYPCYAHRTLGSSGETLRVAWRKCVAKNRFDVHETTILGRDLRFFDFVLSHPRTFHPRQKDRWNRLGNLVMLANQDSGRGWNVCGCLPSFYRFTGDSKSRLASLLWLENWNERSTFALEFCVGFMAVCTFQPEDWGLSPWPLLINEVKNSRLKCTHVHKSRERRKIAGPLGFQLTWLNLYKKGDFIKKPRIVIMMSRGPLTKKASNLLEKKDNKARRQKGPPR